MKQEKTTREELEKKIKTNKDWLEYYFTVDPKSGTLVFKFSNFYSAIIVPPPDAKLIIPRTMVSEIETAEQQKERIQKETEKIEKAINKKVKAGKITKEDGEKEIKRLVEEIPLRPTVNVKKISERKTRFSNISYNIINNYFVKRLRDVITVDTYGSQERTVSDRMKLYFEIYDELIKIIDETKERGRISEEQAEELINGLPNRSTYRDYLDKSFHLSNKIRDGLKYKKDDLGIDNAGIELILALVKTKPEFFDYENLGKIKEEFGINDAQAEYLCGLIGRNYPVFWQMTSFEPIKKIFGKVSFFEEIEFEGALDKENPSPFYELGAGALSGVPVKIDAIPMRLAKLGSYALRETKIEDFSIGRYYSKTSSKESNFALNKYSEFAFAECDDLVKLNIGNKTTVYPTGLCSGCKNLEKHEYSKSLKTIENHAFSGCSKFSNSNFPKSLTTIGFAAFQLCNFTGELYLHDNIKSISSGAFACNKIEKVSIKDAMTDDGTFSRNEKLKTVEYRDGCKTINLPSYKECNNLEEFIIPSSVQTIMTGTYVDDIKNVLEGSKIIFHGTPNQFMNIIISRHFCDPGFYVRNLNSMDDILSGEIKISKDDSLPKIGIEFVNNLLELKEDVKRYYKEYESEVIDKDALVDTLAEIAKEADDSEFIYSTIDEITDVTDLNSALRSADIQRAFNERLVEDECEEILGKER